MPMTASLVILILILFLLVFIGNDLKLSLNQQLGKKHFEIIRKSLDFVVFTESLKKKGKNRIKPECKHFY